MLNSLRILIDGYQADDSSGRHADEHNKIADGPNQPCTYMLTHWLNEEGTDAENNLHHTTN